MRNWNLNPARLPIPPRPRHDAKYTLPPGGVYHEDCGVPAGEVRSTGRRDCGAAIRPPTGRHPNLAGPVSGRSAVSDTQHAQLVAWLEDQGHTAEQIQRILAKVAEYDAKTVHESVFDSISSGTLGLDKIIEEALAEDGDVGD